MEPTSETDLLAGQDRSAPLGPFDAKAAAIIGNSVYTSPNQRFIWYPASTGEVYLRSDFRFGPHDPTLWPQSYIPEYSHLGAIPSKPMDPHHPLSFLWWNPTHGDFISSSGCAVDGIGKLSNARYSHFGEMKKELDNRIATYRNNNPNPPDILPLLETDMLNVFIRLGSLRTTFSQMVFSVTEFQRCYLETLGLLDYLEIYRPRKYCLSKASTVAKCIGVVTNRPNVVQDFFNAGIPVWFCQPRQPGPFPHNVLNVVDPFEPSTFLCVDKADPPFPVVYDGPLDVCEKHSALHRFSRSWLVLKDPFAHELSSATQASTRASTNRTAQGPRSSKAQPPKSGGRDKFAPLHSPLAPFSIPAWRAALRAIDQSVFVKFPSNLYAFPDPGLFVTPKDETKAKFIETWVRTRDAWMTRIAHEGSPAMHAQHWRDFLITDLSNISEATDMGTKSAKRRQYALSLLLSSDPTVVPRCIVGEPFVWQGLDYPPGYLPPENVVRQILWELFELNFAHEFLSLDRRACTSLDLRDKERLYKRQSLISRCFVSKALNHAPLLNTNCGLAAETIQERLPYLRRMVYIMDAWKGTKPAVFALADRAPQSISDQQAKDLEDAATKYYCQQFYNYFGRAPQVPHRLFPVN